MSIANNSHIQLSICIEAEDIFRLIDSGVVYWIPGRVLLPADDYVASFCNRINRTIRKDDAIWYDAHFRVANEEVIRLFGQREAPYLVSALLAAPEYWNRGYAFLQADMCACRVRQIPTAVAIFVRMLTHIFDDVLDGQPILQRYGSLSLLLNDVASTSCSTGANRQVGMLLGRAIGPLEVQIRELKLCFPAICETFGMPALSRALYVFFLRHPEGVQRSDLWRYEAELVALYRQASVRAEVERLETTIHSLVRPNARSKANLRKVIERCNSAVRLILHDEVLQKQYYLTSYANRKMAIPAAKRAELFRFA